LHRTKQPVVLIASAGRLLMRGPRALPTAWRPTNGRAGKAPGRSCLARRASPQWASAAASVCGTCWPWHRARIPRT
jgi:hypothetical protein